MPQVNIPSSCLRLTCCWGGSCAERPALPPSLLSAAAVRSVLPCLLQLLEALKGSLGDVKSWVDLPQARLAYQRQTAQPQVCVQGVWRPRSGDDGGVGGNRYGVKRRRRGGGEEKEPV